MNPKIKTVDPSWLLSQPECMDAFSKNALQFMMVKDLALDCIVWCNEVAAKSLGTTPEAMEGAPSKLFYPDTYQEFHLDDLDIAETGARLGYLESFTDDKGQSHQLMTNKWPITVAGRVYIFIAAIDLTSAVESARNTHEHGRAFDFTALNASVERFDVLIASL